VDEVSHRSLKATNVANGDSDKRSSEHIDIELEPANKLNLHKIGSALSVKAKKYEASNASAVNEEIVDKQTKELLVIRSKDEIFYSQAVRTMSQEYPVNVLFGWRTNPIFLHDQRKKDNKVRTSRYTDRNWIPLATFN